jgi:hypothetical protein
LAGDAFNCLGDGELMPEDEEFRNMMTETPDDKSMYVITNKSK